MKPRELKAILGILRRAGVAKYTFGDLTVEFGDAAPPAPVQAADDAETQQLDLPDGLMDPRPALQRINAKQRSS